MNSSLLKTVGIFLIFLFVVVATSFSLLKGGKSGMSREEIDKIISDHIQNNPQEILESVNKFQQKSQAESEQKAQANVKEKLNDVENDPSSPVTGNKKGDITIAEFFDYSCGYCKKVFPTFIKLIEEDKSVKFVFKELPILGPNSEMASRAALAVHLTDPDKYFEFHKKLMGGHFGSQEAINNEAKNLGINVQSMQEKMKSPEIEKILTKNKELAAAIGIHGTPAFIIGGTLVPGAIDYDALKGIIADARKKKE